MSLTNLLLGALNPATQKASEEALKRAELQNYTEYLKALATELADASKPPLALRSAGVILKNAFYEARSESARQHKIHSWNAIDDQVRQFIQQCVLKALVSPVDEARKSAAQVVGSLGGIELDQGRWPDLVPGLYAAANSPQIADEVKVHVVQAMGFLCEMLDSSSVSEQNTNSLLTVMIDCMSSKRLDQLQLAAITALLNTLDFAQANMNRENERNLIMQKICETASLESSEMRCMAFDCMTKVAELYYEHINMQYLNAIGQLTFAAVRGKDEKAALHALEFWMTLCEIETDLKYEAEDSRQPTTSKRFIAGASQPLVDLVTGACLKRQAEKDADDDEEWNLNMAGGTLLTLMAQAEGDEVLKFTMPFVQANLPLAGPEHWRSRESGLMAFGSVLDGPHPGNLKGWIVEALPFIVSSMDPTREPFSKVRDTAAWCLGIICQYHYDMLSDAQSQDQIARVFLSGLDDPEAIVAAKCAGGLQNLGAAYDAQQDQPRNKLSDYLKQLLPKLVSTSQRPDADRGELRRECFEAVNALVGSAAQDMLPIVSELLQVILQQLHGALTFKIQSSAQKDEVESMMQSCCGSMQVIARKLKSNLQPQQVDNIMTMVLQILTSHAHSAAVMDAHLVIGSVANATQRGFIKFFPVVMPHVLHGLQQSDDYQTCQTATELVSDISRAVGSDIGQIAQVVVPQLLTNLGNGALNRVVKPASILALSDIALALNEQFEPYTDAVFLCLENATMMLNANPPNGEDKDLTDFCNELRVAILETYTSILMSIGGPACQRVFLGHSGAKLDSILNELVNISREVSNPKSEISEDLVKTACGLIGDLAKELGQPAVLKIRSAYSIFSVIIEFCKHSQDDGVRDTAQFTATVLSRH